MKRKFSIVAATLVVTSMLSASAIAQNSPIANSPATTQNTSEIVRWNSYIKEHPRVFSWQAHNELRHLYSQTDEAKSMQQADIILAHSPMDDYILRILSDWQIDKDNNLAVTALLEKANRYTTLPFLHSACLLKSAEIRRAQGRINEARTFNQNAATFARQHRRELRKQDRFRLDYYRKLAQLQTDSLRLLKP